MRLGRAMQTVRAAVLGEDCWVAHMGIVNLLMHIVCDRYDVLLYMQWSGCGQMYELCSRQSEM